MKRLLNLASLVTRPKPPVGTTPSDVVHRENKWRLLRYRPRPEGPSFKTPVLLVPSLINRHYVMDLLPGKSMAQDLVAAGHDVYCIDWGTPTDEDRYLTFDDICDRYLGRAIRHVARSSEREKTHVLGYCLGGTLATIHAAAHQEHIASLLLLAAPVKFSDDGGLLTAWTQTPSFKVGDIVDGFGNVPWQLMQGAFHLLRPTLNLAKTINLIDRAANDEFLNGFLALETWGNDNVSFPGECYRRYIEELYRGDALVKGTFTLSGKPAKLESIRCPVANIVFTHDNIVPAVSASALMDRISSADKTQLELPGGHVGAVVSKAAQKKLWPWMSSYWAQRDADPAPIEVAAPPAPKSAPKPKAAKPKTAKPRTPRPPRSKPRPKASVAAAE
jgi:polyhydroxyalkanoate synthase subunit PhaC